MMRPPASDLPDEAFLQINHRCIARLRRKHPGKSDAELGRALRQAQGLNEHAHRERISAAASLLLAEEEPDGAGPEEGA
jgi:hypothetical protein